MQKSSGSLLASAVAVALALTSGSCRPAGSATGGRSPLSTQAPPVVWDAAAARHVLDRFAFGPRPGEVEALVDLGFERWLQAQLAPAPACDGAARHDPAPCDPALQRALEPYADALEPAAELQKLMKPYFREHLAHLVAAQLTRQLLSVRQLEETMIDFWANHFNIFAPKGLVRTFAGDYVERVLRPHALGRFQDLLLATACHPAMLIYLDNASSTVRRGLNENYARELLELHTLGVGAYTQNDVVGAARILTGWTVSRPGQPGRPFEFVFRLRQHDFGPKTVLDETYPAGQGEAEGVRLLERLATHPATALHLARKLCVRFVADDPPESCTRAAEEAFSSTRGDLRAVIVAIAHDPSFWQARRGKLKRPLELVVSALRAMDARLDGTARIARSLKALGEPMLEESVPTGYPEDAAAWASSGGFLARMSFATALGFERSKGIVVDVGAVLSESEPEALVAHGNRALLGGSGSEQTLSAIQSALAQQPDAIDRRRLAAALFLGSPEFQRQ